MLTPPGEQQIGVDAVVLRHLRRFAEYHNIGILVWSSLAGGFLAGKYSRAKPAPAGRAEAIIMRSSHAVELGSVP